MRDGGFLAQGSSLDMGYNAHSVIFKFSLFAYILEWKRFRIKIANHSFDVLKVLFNINQFFKNKKTYLLAF